MTISKSHASIAALSLAALIGLTGCGAADIDTTAHTVSAESASFSTAQKAAAVERASESTDTKPSEASSIVSSSAVASTAESNHSTDTKSSQEAAEAVVEAPAGAGEVDKPEVTKVDAKASVIQPVPQAAVKAEVEAGVQHKVEKAVQSAKSETEVEAKAPVTKGEVVESDSTPIQVNVENTDPAPTVEDETSPEMPWSKSYTTPFGDVSEGSDPSAFGYKGFDGFTVEQAAALDWAVNPGTFGSGAIACLPAMVTVGCVTSTGDTWQLAPSAEAEHTISASYKEGSDSSAVPVVEDLVADMPMSRTYFTPFGNVREGTNPGYGAFDGFTQQSALQWAHRGDAIAPMEAGTLVCSPTVEFGCVVSDGFKWGLVSQDDAHEIAGGFDFVDYHAGGQQD